MLLMWYSRRYKRWLCLRSFCPSRVSMIRLKFSLSSTTTSLMRTSPPVALSLSMVSSESMFFLKMEYLSKKERVSVLEWFFIFVNYKDQLTQTQNTIRAPINHMLRAPFIFCEKKALLPVFLDASGPYIGKLQVLTCRFRRAGVFCFLKETILKNIVQGRRRWNNIINMKLSQLISLLLTLGVVFSACVPETQLTNLESGLIDASASSQMFQLAQGQQSQYTYQFKNKFTSKPQIAFSLNFFDGNPIGGFGFGISANTSETGMLTILSTPSPLIKWTQLRFTFLANARNDLQVGQNTVQNWNPNQKITAIKFIEPIKNVSLYAARSFLSGIQIPLIVGNLALQVTGLVFNETVLTVGVSSNSVIKSITLSYVLFPISSQTFSSSSGVFAEQSVQGTTYQNAQGALNSLNYYIYGVTGFQLQKSKFSLSSSMSDTYLLSVTGSAKNVVVSYLSLGVSPSKACEKCNTSFVLYKYSCANSCESNMVTYKFQNKMNGCIMCNSGAGFKNSVSGCVCEDGKTLVRGSCINNNKIQNANLTSTQIQSKFFKDLSSTVPQNGVTYAIGDNAFALGGSQCTDPNSYFSGSICVCRPGFYNISGSCTSCPSGSYYNGNVCISASTGLPIGVSNNNNFQTSFNVNGATSFVQLAPSTGISNPSMPLPSGALPLGQYNNQGVNIASSNFVTGSMTSGLSGSMTSGFAGSTTSGMGGFGASTSAGIGGTSPPAGALPLGRYLDDGTNLNTFGNSNGNFGIGNSSLQDFLSSIYSFSSSSSSSFSSGFGFGNFDDPSYFFPAGMIPTGSSFSQLSQFSLFNNTRVCPINEYFNSSACVCVPGFIRGPNGVCILTSSLGMTTFSTSIQSTDTTLLVAPNRTQCTSAYSYVTPDGYCTCQIGYVFNTNYLCFPVPTGMNCPQGSILYSNNSCLCPRNFFNNSGVCMTCPPFNYWNGATCVASCPANSYYNSTNRNCSCNPGFITTSNNICTACPPGSTSFNNMCVGCPINSIMINGQCTCAPGSTFTNNSCVAFCPPNTYYDANLAKCLCVQPNFFVDNNNVCVACPNGNFYNGETCIPCSGSNYYDPVTRTCQSCSGRSMVFNSRCLSCPQGTTWSTTLNKCICNDLSRNAPIYCRVIGSGASDNGNCPSNGNIVNGICIICPFNSRFMNGACQCNSGFINDTSSNPRGVCVQVCSSGVLSTQGLCVVCPQNSAWNPAIQSCSCTTGFAPSAQGQCVQTCGIGAQSVNGVCQCMDGYYPINGNSATCGICSTGCARCTSQSVCSQCEPSFTFVGTSCVGRSASISSSGTTVTSVTTVSTCNIANCSQCSVSAFNCISCNLGFTLVNPMQCTLTALLLASGSSTTQTSTTTTTTTTGGSLFCIGGCKVYQKCNTLIGRCENNTISVSSSGLTLAQLLALQTSSSSSRSVSTSGSSSFGSGTITVNNVRSAIGQTSFTASVSPDASGISFGFPNLAANVIPKGSCAKVGNSMLWNCIVSYQNQPISVVYSITLTASSNAGQWSQTFTVDPIRATMS